MKSLTQELASLEYELHYQCALVILKFGKFKEMGVQDSVEFFNFLACPVKKSANLLFSEARDIYLMR